MNTHGSFPLGQISMISLLSKGLSVFPAPQVESISSLTCILLYGPNLASIHDRWEYHNFDYMHLCWQSDISAFQYALQVCHNFSSKGQASSLFTAAVTKVEKKRRLQAVLVMYTFLRVLVKLRSTSSYFSDLLAFVPH